MCTVQTALFKLLECDDEEFVKLLKSENLDKLVHIKEKSEKSQNQGANIQLNERNS